MSGFYLMHRGWMDNPVFKAEPFTEREAWEWIISHAAYVDTVHRIGSSVVEIRRGQIAVTMRELADEWSWSKSRVFRVLKTFENADMIGTQTGTGMERTKTIITVCNYEYYQVCSDRDGTQTGTEEERKPGQARDRRGTLKKEVKEIKEDIEDSPLFPPIRDTMEGVESRHAEKATANSRGTRLSADWTIPGEWVDWAIAHGHMHPLDESEKFRDYWHSQPGARGRKADWFATWRNWIRTSLGGGRRRPGATPYTPRKPSGDPGGVLGAVVRMNRDAEDEDG